MGEKNRVRWVGIRPTDPPETIPVEEQSPLTEIGVKPVSPRQAIPTQPYRDFGTQIAKEGNAVNATVIIHTVSTGKTLYLCSVSFSVYPTANGMGALYCRDTDDALQYIFFIIRRQANDGFATAMSFNPPLVIPAGYDLCVRSWNDGFDTRGFIFGYEL